MRIGPITVRLIALSACGLVGGDLLAQTGGPEPSHAVQAVFYAPTGQANSYSDGYGNPDVVPANYCGGSCSGGYGGEDGYCSSESDGCGDECSCEDGYGCGDGQCRGGLLGRMHCWPHRCEGCPGTNPPYPQDVENLSLMPPSRTEQCGPHYWDFRAEAVALKRDDAFGRGIDFSQQGLGGQFVLNSNQLDYDYQTGFRVFGRYDLCPLSVLEFGYMGIFDMKTSATATASASDPASLRLFSLFSDDPTTQTPDFGTTPTNVVLNGPQGQMADTERATSHTISLESDLQNAEMNYRRYWVGFSPCISGTCLAGFRYTRLRETFLFDTIDTVEQQEGKYSTRAENNLAGFQTGGDVWVHIWQGFRVGAEGKVGICDNHYNVVSNFAATSGNPVPVFTHEEFAKDEPALLSEASLDAVCDVCPSWSVRAGYEILFLNSVALAGDNFNSASPYQIGATNTSPAQATRIPFVADQAHAFYSGFHVGFEYIW